MKKIIILMTIFLMTGCTVRKSDDLSSNININIESNLEATITVGEKISGTGYETVILGLFRTPNSKYTSYGTTSDAVKSSFFNFVENAKGKAVYEAKKSSNADLIIHPEFIITEENFFFYKTIKCEVSGYKGTIKTIK